MKEQPRLSSTSILIVVIILGMVVGGVFLTRGQATNIKPPKKVPRVKVSEPVDYSSKRVDTTMIKSQEAGKFVTISVDEVKRKRLVRFEFRSPKMNVHQRNFAGKKALPVIAYITPAGELFVGVSYCEPCRSTNFHTEGDLTLTCNVCGTKWSLGKHIALSGACMPYPPDEFQVAVEDGKVLIRKSILENWVPRAEI